MLKLPNTPPLSGAALRALVVAAEAPATGAVIFAMMTKQMGIDEVLKVPADAEPLPTDSRPLLKGTSGLRRTSR